MATAKLSDRGVVRVSGEDARAFLNGLVTSDVGRVGENRARYAALLSPQGKILFDFLVAEADGEQGGAFYLDAPRALAGDLAKRLGLYKLRAKVAVADLSDTLGVVAFFDGERAPEGVGVAFADPRAAALGDRLVVETSLAGPYGGAEVAYEALRVALAVPAGGLDFAYGDAFPHEANLDQFAGVDFDKGCYVGQEVVSRMQHRGTVRTRVVPVQFEGEPPPSGTPATADGKPLGSIGSAGAGGRALALLRLDRVEDALGAGQPLEADGRRFRLGSAPALRFLQPGRGPEGA